MPRKKSRKGIGGRKSKYTPEISAKIGDLARKGLTDAQMADIIGVCPRTLNYWKGKYPEFLHTLKESKATADDLVEASLFRRATGYSYIEKKAFNYFGEVIPYDLEKHFPPDTAAAIFWLKNRRPEKWRETKPEPDLGAVPVSSVKKSFMQFCLDAGYPAPFPKQVEMKDFILKSEDVSLLLGARGYGKTDYVTIMGIAYEIYLDPLNATFLIVTKSDSRNMAIVGEILNACKRNGVRFETENAILLRAKGLHGKDPSVEALTIGSKGFRGRHPKKILMDDPVTEDDVSEATRRKVERVYNELMKLTKNIGIIGQPAHKYDLFEKLRSIVNKMEVPFGSIPELDADLEAQRLAGVTEESIQASYYLVVKSESGSPFDGVQYIDDFIPGESVAYIDPSNKGKDYTALSIFRGNFDCIVVKGHVHKKAWNHCIDEMLAQMKACNVKKICIECNALGDQPVLALRQALAEAGITGVGVVGRESTTNKHSRIMAAGIYASKIQLAKTSDRLYIDHVVKYEYGSEPDDAPDSLATGLAWIGLVRGKE